MKHIRTKLGNREPGGMDVGHCRMTVAEINGNLTHLLLPGGPRVLVG